MIIREVENIEEAKRCNELLTKLIKDENKYNDNINTNTLVVDYYDNIFLKENNKLFVAIDNNIIVGYIYLKLTDPSKNCELYKEAIIDALYVEEEYRNKKIATNLITEAKQYAKENGAKKISINVIKDNEVAHNLYSKLGFKEFSVRMKQEI